MNKQDKILALNSLSSLTLQVLTVICGFILPRFILTSFGSDVNGMVSSITQFLSFVNFLDLGIGAVVLSAYYKPLANKDFISVSEIYNWSRKYFRCVSFILTLYVVLLCIIYPQFINREFDFLYVISLILILSISQFAQYLFAIPDQILLNADQKLYIQNSLQIITVIANTFIGVVLIKLNCSIHIVKLFSAAAYVIRPFVLHYYVSKHFMLEKKSGRKKYKLEQQWNGVAQHIATVVMNSTDVMLLSIFSTTSFVSVYAIYNLVISGVKQLISSLSNGFTSLLGELYAKDEANKLNKYFDAFDWGINNITVFIFGAVSVLIVPFVMNYTQGVNDAQYKQPMFAFVFVLAQGLFCLRLSYNSMIVAAGHFKQTQASAIIEMVLNLVITVLCVKKYSLLGVAIGTLAAILYRTLYFIIYLHKNILYRNIRKATKQVSIDLLEVTSLHMVIHFIRIPANPYISYIAWIIYALYVCFLLIVIIFIFNVIFYRDNLISIAYKIKMKGKTDK